MPPSDNRIDFDLLDYKYFTIPSIIDIIPNSPTGHQLLTQANNNVWIVAMIGE